MDNSHPLAEGIALEGVVWAAARLTNAPGEVPVILAGNTPLLSAREDALGRRHLTLNFNPDLSTLQNTPDWPILFWNLLQWRAAEIARLEGKQRPARHGSEFENHRRTRDGHPAGRRRRHGFRKPAANWRWKRRCPGIYSVVAGAVTNRFAVNALAADESDLSACATGQWGEWSEDTERRLEETSAVWIFGLLALALLTTHLYLRGDGERRKLIMFVLFPTRLAAAADSAGGGLVRLAVAESRGLKILRAVIFVLVVLALAQLAIKLPDRAGTVVVVADRSESMPQNSDASEKEIIGLLHKSMGPRDQLGVVAFGREAIVEQSPQRGEFGGFTAQVGADHSSLNDAH